MSKKKSSEIVGDRWEFTLGGNAEVFWGTPKKGRSKISVNIWPPRFWSSGSASE